MVNSSNDHREFIPKNPSSDYDPRKIVKANIYAYGITAFFFLSFLCEILAGYSYAFAPKSKPKEEENVVIPEVESIPQPEKEPENKNENNVTITPVENNPPNNPVIVQTTMAFGAKELNEDKNINVIQPETKTDDKEQADKTVVEEVSNMGARDLNKNDDKKIDELPGAYTAPVQL